MKGALQAFSTGYRRALGAYLEAPEERPLHSAYELGRYAIGEGLSILDVVDTHRDAITAHMEGPGRTTGIGEVLARATRFLAECVSSFDITYRGFRAAITQLEGEIAERKRTEMHLRSREADLAEASRQRAEDLSNFAIMVQRAQEEERQRIARELHDDVCQRLTALRMHLNVFENDIPGERRTGLRRLQAIKAQIDGLITEVRRISSNLRPSALDLFGLHKALQMLCRETEETHGVRVVFRPADEPPRRLDGQVEIALFRIAEEALMNAARHAHATTIWVSLAASFQDAVLTVRDDGAGFVARERVSFGGHGHGMGLFTMRERAALLGGRCAVQSSPREGTTVHVIIPYQSGVTP